MPEDNKLSIAELETKYGVLAIDRTKYPANKKFTEKEFAELRTNDDDFLGINLEDRTAFLEANGFEVTHANLINTDLHAEE